jgi:hypothetical protein
MTAIVDYTITLWFPCLDGLIQIRGNVARVKKSAFLNSSNMHSQHSHGNHKVIVL